MYDTTYYDSGLGALVGMFIGVFVVIMLVVLIAAIIVTIAQWKMFKKAGEEGWKAIIPVYNVYTLCKIVGVNPYWILIVMLGSLLSGVPLVGLVSFAASIYFQILLNVSIAKSFGKDGGFAVGLIFVPYIFYPILGLGKAEYIGAQPMDDIIFKNKTSNTNNTNQSNINSVPNTASQTTNVENPAMATQNTPGNNVVDGQSTEILDETTSPTPQPAAAYCTNCGNQLAPGDAFCTNCGTKVN